MTFPISIPLLGLSFILQKVGILTVKQYMTENYEKYEQIRINKELNTKRKLVNEEILLKFQGKTCSKCKKIVLPKNLYQTKTNLYECNNC